MPTTQMNIRIDETTKRKGDAVFSKIGYTPTQVVRIMWEYATCMQAKPEEVSEALQGMERTIDPSNDEKLSERLRAVENGQQIFSQFLRQMGVEDLESFDDAGTLAADLREQAAWDRALEKGWVSD